MFVMAQRALMGLGLLLLAALAILLLWAGWTALSVRQDSVSFQSGDLTLRGTLLMPRFGDNHPGVVLVHGSGETSRKSMMTYAWVFASQGYAALAYDKRGVGESDGGPFEWRDFSFDHLAADAQAGYALLQARPGVDPDRVGFLGASQGAWVVSLAANRVKSPAFLILASGSVSTVAEDRLFGREAEARRLGLGETEVREAVELLKLDQAVTRSGEGLEALASAWTRARNTPWFSQIYPNAELLAADDPRRAWERTILDFDPQPLLQSLKTPVLWIFGDPALDRLSPVALSLQRIEAAKLAGKPYTIIQINGVGHTLELEGDRDLETLARVQLPMLWRVFRWLNSVAVRGASRPG